MLDADDACIVSRSPRGLGRMMAVFVEVFGTFGLTISESKTETVHADPACIDNKNSLQRHEATVPRQTTSTVSPTSFPVVIANLTTRNAIG